MMMLSEAQETLMKEVTVMVPVNDLTEELIGKLSCTVKDNRGKVMLRVKVYRSGSRCGSKFVFEEREGRYDRRHGAVSGRLCVAVYADVTI